MKRKEPPVVDFMNIYVRNLRPKQNKLYRPFIACMLP